MTQPLRKCVSSLLSLATAFAFAGVGLVSSVQAGQIQNAKATLDDVRATRQTAHTIQFDVATETSINKITLQYTNTASGGSAYPPGLSTASATESTMSVGGTDETDWTLDGTTTPGTLSYTKDSSGVVLTAGSTVSIKTANMINNKTSIVGGDNPLCDSVPDSESCWIRIATYATDGGAVVDQTTITYTVINPITVTATVDPILTFTVSGVNGASINENDGNYGGAGTLVTTTSTTVPFGNLSVGTAKVGQQGLRVLTNANNGYTVYHKFVGAQLMTGTYGANNIDKFIGDGAASWAAPQVWIAPTGNSNSSDSAWIGLRTTNATGGANFVGGGNANKYAPPHLDTGDGSLGSSTVISRATPDNGTTTTYVTYKIEANAFQASDQYTGTMVYNVVARY
jgi:hypothetical protein